MWRVPTSPELASLYYAVPNNPFTGTFDAAVFFDGTPFSTSRILTWGGGPMFWSSTSYTSGDYIIYYVWSFDPDHTDHPAFPFVSGPGGVAADCWCVGKQYPPEAFDWIP